MNELIEKLNSGEATLMVEKCGEERAFFGRGIDDIYTLLLSSPEYLRGATIADKIIGKGAAAVMILARPKEIYTNVISENALELFGRYGVEVSYGELTPHIIRRDGQGWCPVELLCRNIESAEGCLQAIKEFMKNKK